MRKFSRAVEITKQNLFYRLPEWTKKVFYPGCQLEELSGLAFQLSTVTTEMARLKSGFLIREIFDRFYNKISGDLSPNRSIWIYSAHDSTIANVLNALGLFEPHFPPYASSIMFELYQTNSDYYVQIFYKNTTGEQLTPLNIPRCGPKCTLGQLTTIYKAILPTRDFDSECRLSVLTLPYTVIGVQFIEIGRFHSQLQFFIFSLYNSLFNNLFFFSSSFLFSSVVIGGLGFFAACLVIMGITECKRYKRNRVYTRLGSNYSTF